MKLIIEHLVEVIEILDIEAIKAMLQKTIEGDRIFGGRKSGLVAKAFANAAYASWI